MTQAEKIIEIAQKELGTTEYPSNSNRVKYNTWYYGKEVSGSSYPWCAVFVNWVFDQAGLQDLFYGGKKCASCTQIRNFYKTKGQIVKDYKPGDLLILNFKKSNNGECQHIGILVNKNGNTLYTIEGNTGSGNDANGGAVQRRERNISQVVSIIRPAYEQQENPIRKGQKYLNDKYSCGLAVDGIIGPKTKAALKQAYKREFSKAAILKLKNTGANVALCQCALCLNSFALDIDGIFGNKTLEATKAYQKSHKLKEDGIIGPLTQAALFGDG